MASPYGVFAQGFVIKPLSAVRQDLIDAQVQTIDPGLDTSSSNPLGQLNGIIANAIAETWELAQVAYDGFDRDNAEGAALANIGALTGTLPLAPKPSAVLVQLSLAVGTYLAGTLVASVANTGPSIAPGALTASVAQRFSNAQDITVGVGQLNSLGVPGVDGALFASLEDGPIVAPAGWLTAIAIPVTGWTSLTNGASGSFQGNDAVLGNLLQTDAEYRVRQEQELTAPGSCTLDSTRADLLNIPGVSNVTIFENTTSVYDPVTGLPPKSFECVLLVSSFVSIGTVALTIWNDKPAGMQSFGSSSYIIQDSQGVARSVNYTLVTPVVINLAYVCSFLASMSPLDKKNAGLQLATTALMLSQGYAYSGTALPPGTPGVLVGGGPVIALAYAQLVFGVGGITDCSLFALDRHPVVPTFTATDAQKTTIPAGSGAGRTIGSQNIGQVLTNHVVVYDGATGPPTQVYP